MLLDTLPVQQDFGKSYSVLEQERAYVTGTADQFRSDSDIVRDNLYGGFAPKEADAFAMHDPFMDEDFCPCEPQNVPSDEQDYHFSVPLSAVKSYYVRNDYAPNTVYSEVIPRSLVRLDRLTVRSETYTAPNGRIVIEDVCYDKISGYHIWEHSFWPD